MERQGTRRISSVIALNRFIRNTLVYANFFVKLLSYVNCKYTNFIVEPPDPSAKKQNLRTPILRILF